MGIITLERANQLYWLGRYAERVYTTIKEYFIGYDTMIDESEDSYKNYCKSVDVPDVYGSKEVFLEKYPFDTENPDSILSNLMRAYDNALVLRDELGSETIAYIQMAIYDMQKAVISRSPLIEMQKVVDNLLAFWGCMDDEVGNEYTRNIMKIGRRVERVDLSLRFGKDRDYLAKEVKKLVNRAPRTGLEYDKEALKKIQTDIGQGDYNVRELVAILETFIQV